VIGIDLLEIDSSAMWKCASLAAATATLAPV
jgi:hypothetical protein